MYEYEVMNKETKITMPIFGYTLADAYRRAKLIPADYQLLFRTYID